MRQLTLRIPEALGEELKQAATARAMSVNRFAGAVLAAAVDPDLDENQMERLRGRLLRAGLLEIAEDRGATARPDTKRLEAARSRAGRGQSLSGMVSADRR